ncbi:MAG: SGNH/GDSL hydrolase family protein [Thermoguttaceae bacterium]|nr:SGNH/GDSL hydrolase family protein [Thermoguttaceae bacterium]MDW8078166.1 SGNH/GDSL hydrolase family protein [Thermoguttaceae bacterium]
MRSIGNRGNWWDWLRRAIPAIWIVGGCLLTTSHPAIYAQEMPEDVVKHMREVHKQFRGEKGTLAFFGDSISVSLAFWAPLAYECRNVPPELDRALKLIRKYLRPECWRDWRGGQYGNEGGQTIRWAYENVDRWLERLRPETAVIMFGTNDLAQLDEAEYREKLAAVVRRCLDRGTVVILSTIPPRHGFEEKSARFANIARQIARELKVPLVDYHAEILKRRPNDWDGALPAFAGYDVYEVPTLIAGDGIHPSNPQKYMGDFSPEALRTSGYGLRNYLTALCYGQVIEKVLTLSDK